MNKMTLIGLAVAACALVISDDAKACQGQGDDNTGCGAPAPVPGGGLAAMIMLAAGTITLLRGRNRK